VRKPLFPDALSLRITQIMSSAQVGAQTEMTVQSVNDWVKRFEAEGIEVLHTRPGQGRNQSLLRR
jgi:transposase